MFFQVWTCGFWMGFKTRLSMRHSQYCIDVDLTISEKNREWVEIQTTTSRWLGDRSTDSALLSTHCWYTDSSRHQGSIGKIISYISIHAFGIILISGPAMYLWYLIQSFVNIKCLGCSQLDPNQWLCKHPILNKMLKKPRFMEWTG